MTMLPLLLVISLTVSAQTTPPNPCANGSFEQVSPKGVPNGWAPLGKFEISTDVHSGKRSLRLVRTSEPPTRETGVNAQNIDQLKGGMEFYYKAVSARDAVLHLYAIPIAADGVERTNTPRATFTIPKEHVGDGQWHRGRLKYDFTKNPLVKSVIFGARVIGTAGELLLDDFAYLDRVGPLLRIGTVRHEEDPQKPGERWLLHVPIENKGDVAAPDVRLKIDLPQGLKAEPGELALGTIAPEGRALPRWIVNGPRTRVGTMDLAASSGSEKITARIEIKPQLLVKSWGPTSPWVLIGEPIELECLLQNTGTATMLHPRVVFSVEKKKIEKQGQFLHPGGMLTLKASVPFRGAPDLRLVFPPISREGGPEVGVSVYADQLPPLNYRSLASLRPVLPPSILPPPSGSLKALTGENFALLENENLRLAFPNLSVPGFGELSVKTSKGWQLVAWVEGLCSFSKNKNSINFPGFLPPRVEKSSVGKFRLGFVAAGSDPPYHCQVTLELGPLSNTIRCVTELVLPPLFPLFYFEGPIINVFQRDEAIFPGVEWLLGNELSSDSLDIAETHPDRDRTSVHPNFITIPAIGLHSQNGTVGLLWDVHQKWDGTHDRPSVWFSSPDRQQHRRSHRLGLFLHSEPGRPRPIRTNAKGVAEPYLLEPGKTLKLESLIYADGSAKEALSVVDEWTRIYGIAKPAPLPRGSYEREIEFSMQGYLKSLWVPEEKKWWTSKGGGIMSTKERPRDYVADLLVGALLSPDPEIRRQCRARADEVLALIGGEPRLDAQRFPGRQDQALAETSTPAGLLATRDKNGAWFFDADQVGTGPFVGLDYHDLGPDHAVEVGTCASRATRVLRYARMTGDREAYRQMLPTLALMESFRVPRAAQVWEVPVHTPDILAAGEAVEAFLEAYHFSGDQRWLRDAVTWARRGLPFVYLWNDPEKPFLLGGSIPVFGATWMQGSWFGRPVQWNGLRYAEAILKLAEYDKSYPWRQIATAITHSAIHQQDTKGENVALWPDNISAIDSEKCPWVFAPRMILANILRLMGRDEDVATAIVGQGDRRLHINANARLSEVSWDGRSCRFQVSYPPGQQGVVVVFNLARPTGITLDGQPLPLRQDLEKGSAAGWRYEPSLAALSLRVPRDGKSTIQIDGAEYRQGPRLPQLVEKIAFDFANSLEGWSPAHYLEDLTIQNNALVGRITGPDPYLVRSQVRIRGDDCPVVVVRMRVSAGHGGQLYWATAASPAIAEDKVLNFPIQADGQFHEYRLEVGQHPLWKGQTITALRIDPGNGAREGEFAIDYIRAEPRTR